MTTKVKVFANHGWDVKVQAIMTQGEVETVTSETIVKADSEQEFYVHDGHDIRVSEIQPT